MSSDEESSSNASIGQKRQRALQLGPRKKLYANSFLPCVHSSLDVEAPAAEQTHLCIMEGTLGALSTPSAMSTLY
jgi:hypothetical protein